MTLRPALLLTLLGAAPLAAQLPMIGVPHRVIRFEIAGAFRPADDVWRDGKKVPVGDLLSGPLDATSTPVVGDLERGLATVLGRAATPGSLGSLQTVAQWQHNVGTISAAWGATSKLTIFGTIPIVSVRTERKTSYDATGSTLGVNPANVGFGTAEGLFQTTSFLTNLDNTLQTLGERINNGDYTDATLALAQQTLSDVTTFRNAATAVFGSDGSLVLPLAGSPDALALTDRLAALSTTLNNDLGISSFSGAPAFPVDPISADLFGALLESPVGFNFRPRGGQPVTALGRVEIGANLELFRRSTETDSIAMLGYGHALLRLGTGSDPSPYALMDQGTGGKAHEIELGGTVALQRPGSGVRGDATVTLPLGASAEQRIGGINEILLPVSRIGFATRRAGPGVTLAAQPWVTLTPHLSLSGLAHFAWRGEDHLTFTALGGGSVLDPDAAAAGTGYSALRLGLGLNYIHDGRNHLGVVKMPVEAGFSVERTVMSGGGLVPAELTSRVYIRFYKK